MDLNIVIVLLVTFIAGGHSLICYECTGETGSCKGVMKTCPNTANTCSTTKLVVSIGDNKVNELTKKCDMKQNCVSGSMNFGVFRTTLSTQCCNTYLCNNKDVPDTSSNSPNGKQCYYCDGKSCSNRLNCLGTEDYCITATSNSGSASTIVKGCASKIFCDAVTSKDIEGNTDFSCCYGNLCNGFTQDNDKILTQNNDEILTQNNDEISTQNNDEIYTQDNDKILNQNNDKILNQNNDKILTQNVLISLCLSSSTS